MSGCTRLQVKKKNTLAQEPNKPLDHRSHIQQHSMYIDYPYSQNPYYNSTRKYYNSDHK